MRFLTALWPLPSTRLHRLVRRSILFEPACSGVPKFCDLSGRVGRSVRNLPHERAVTTGFRLGPGRDAEMGQLIGGVGGTPDLDFVRIGGAFCGEGGNRLNRVCHVGERPESGFIQPGKVGCVRSRIV